MRHRRWDGYFSHFRFQAASLKHRPSGMQQSRRLVRQLPMRRDFTRRPYSAWIV